MGFTIGSLAKLWIMGKRAVAVERRTTQVTTSVI